MHTIEPKPYIYGVGLVIVRGAALEYYLHRLVEVVAGESKADIKETLKGQFGDVAKGLKRLAPSRLDDVELLDRLHLLLGDCEGLMRERDLLAHSAWILDPEAPEGTDTRVHIRTETEERISSDDLEKLAAAFGVASVNFLVLMNKIIEHRGGKGGWVSGTSLRRSRETDRAADRSARCEPDHGQ